MYNDDQFKIGNKNQNVYDLINSDEDNLADLIEKGDIELYKKNDFKPEFIELLNKDLQILEDIQVLWSSVKTDFKLEKFIKVLNENEELKNKKIIIFSESKETCENLFENLSKKVTDGCMVYTSKDAKINLEKNLKVLNKDRQEK